jgi:MFS family permease
MTMTARTATLIVACIGVLLAQVDTSVVNLAVHRIRDAFGADPRTLRWVVDSYNLTYAGAILSAGGLGDILGRRRLFVVGTIVFTIGSIGCTLAPNDAALIGARAVTGIGAALEVPATLALLSVPSTTRAGIALLPMSIVFVLTSSFSGRIVARNGVRASIVGGMAAMGAGCLLLAVGGTQNTLTLSLGLASTGLGMGLATGQLLGYAVSRAPGERAGTASGIGNAARMIGATLGVAIIGGSFALAQGGDLTPLRMGYAGGGIVQLLGALAAFAWIREGAA